MKILVVGGAGYIGSHCVRQIILAGHQPIVLDNLEYGHRGAVGPEIPFYEGDLADESCVLSILQNEKSISSCISLLMPRWAKAFNNH